MAKLCDSQGLPRLRARKDGARAPNRKPGTTTLPWRNRAHRIVAQRFPHMVTPHFGWFDGTLSRQMIDGEAYARLINTSMVAPTCGTIAKEVVPKHFEIPGCATCLVTEPSAALASAGFVNSVNCLFAEEDEIGDALDWLFQHPEDLKRISQAGCNWPAPDYMPHRAAQRSLPVVFLAQGPDWQPAHRPTRSLSAVDGYGASRELLVTPRPPHFVDRGLLAEGDAALKAGDVSSATATYRRCLNYHVMSEANLRLALSYLHDGRPRVAISLIRNELERSFARGSAMRPDPVEWAYLIIALLVPDAGRPRRDVPHGFPRSGTSSWTAPGA